MNRRSLASSPGSDAGCGFWQRLAARTTTRILAGGCRFSDGLWAWHAGSRLSPSASHTEIGSWHLDIFADEELGPDVYEQADQLADEILGEARRFESPASVVEILDYRHDGTFR